VWNGTLLGSIIAPKDEVTGDKIRGKAGLKRIKCGCGGENLTRGNVLGRKRFREARVLICSMKQGKSAMKESERNDQWEGNEGVC